MTTVEHPYRLPPLAPLVVLFDDACGFCTEAARWLALQPQRVPLHLVPRTSDEGAALIARAGTLDELLVLDARGGVYEGEAALLMCLWACEGYETIAHRFGAPALRHTSRRLFHLLSKNRLLLSDLLGLVPRTDRQLEMDLGRVREPLRCAS